MFPILYFKKRIMKKIFSILVSIIILSGCATDGVLKKSANNKLIDSKGLQGEKRRPLYNKKYIDKAKLNIARGDYDEDEEYSDEQQYIENLPPALKNCYIYEDMIEEDIQKARARRAKKKSVYLRRMKQNPDSYPNLGKGRDAIKSGDVETNNTELKKELKEIRTLLDATREDLVKYRCPIDENGKPMAMKHEVKPQKIHEDVKAEEAAKPPGAKKVVQKKPVTPKVAPAPAPKPAPQPVKAEVPQHQHNGEDALHHGSDAHAHPHQPTQTAVKEEEDYFDPTLLQQESVQESTPAETVTLVPDNKPEIQELVKPHLTEIPPAPEGDEAEETSVSIPDLPGFPTP